MPDGHMSLPAADSPGLAPAISGESEVRRQMAAAEGRIKRLKRVDRVAVGVITFGGIAVILSVIGILIFIGAEAVPLFRPSSSTFKGTLRPADSVARAPMDRWALGSDDFDRYVYTLEPSGRVSSSTARQERPNSPSALRHLRAPLSSRRRDRCWEISSPRARPTDELRCCRSGSCRSMGPTG